MNRALFDDIAVYRKHGSISIISPLNVYDVKQSAKHFTPFMVLILVSCTLYMDAALKVFGLNDDMVLSDCAKSHHRMDL